MMHTMSFQAPDEMKQRLDHYAQLLDRSKGHLIRAALDEYLEDMEDFIAVRKHQATHNPKENVSFDEIKREFNLD